LRWWGFYKNDKEGVDSRMDSAVATAGINPANLKALDDMVRTASQAKLWIVLFVDSDCGQNGAQNEKEVKFCDPTGQYKGEHNFWTDPAMKAKFISLWRFIANRYKDTPYMGIFEPLPEPGPPSASPQQVTDFYTELMGAIRSVAPGIPFMVGPIHYRAKEIRTAYNPAWKDVIYTGNLFYHTGGGEQSGVEGVRKRVQDMVALRNERNVPLFVQQVGVKAGEDPDQSKTKAVLKILVDNRIGFAYWQYRGAENPDNYGVIFKRGNTWQPKPAELNAVAGSFKQ
jgi:hypothetical protein